MSPPWYVTFFLLGSQEVIHAAYFDNIPNCNIYNFFFKILYEDYIQGIFFSPAFQYCPINMSKLLAGIIGNHHSICYVGHDNIV